MTVVRMWETRLDPAGVDAFWGALRGSWPELVGLDGCERAEAFASAAGEPRAVVVSHWRDETAAAQAVAWETGLDRYGARAGFGWHFVAVDPTAG